MTPSPEQASALERWAFEAATALCPDLDELGRFRVVIGLLQARAMESRHISGLLLVNAGHNQLMAQLGMQLGDRAERLERYGMEIAKRMTESSTGIVQ